LSRKTERVFVIYNVTLAAIAVIFLFLGASVIQEYGYAGGFTMFACVDFLALLVIYRGYPRFRLASDPGNTESPTISTRQQQGRMALLALTLFGVALAGTQTFVERLGSWHGADVQALGTALALGWCLAIVSPFTLSPLIRKWGRLVPLVFAYLLVASVAFALSFTTSLCHYLIAAALFTPVIMLIEPLQFGILGVLDQSGRLAALGPPPFQSVQGSDR
jgi:predicted MFS family arabinose efflux permease